MAQARGKMGRQEGNTGRMTAGKYKGVGGVGAMASIMPPSSKCPNK